jgi:hypothetical protein
MNPFFQYAAKRQNILHLRRDGLPRPWTDDYALQTFSFCNVFREDDKVTIWFRKNVRERVSSEHLLIATAVFRWFNRISTGVALFLQPALNGTTAWERFIDQDYDVALLRAAIMSYCGAGPYTTGAYIINSPNGMDKLTGVLHCIGRFAHEKRAFPAEGVGDVSWWEVTQMLQVSGDVIGLEDVWSWLRGYEGLGDFMAYELVTDLNHTPLMDRAPDRMTWANPGPGAMRGLNRLHGRDLYWRKKGGGAKEHFIQEMRDLLEQSRHYENWPTDWPQWDMRTVEHTLCEYDKYTRVQTGEGKPRNLYRGGA